MQLRMKSSGSLMSIFSATYARKFQFFLGKEEIFMKTLSGLADHIAESLHCITFVLVEEQGISLYT